MELLQLKYLCTAARFENFSRAARYHNIPQSAISKTVAQLERELGVQLFIRVGNRVTVSEAGKKFCREVGRALDAITAAAAAARAGADDALHGRLHLLVEEHGPALTRLLSTFRQDNPGVSISLYHTPEQGLDYDLRICARTALGDHLAADALRPATVYLLTPPTHRLDGQGAPLPAMLRGEKLITLAKKDAAQAAAATYLRHTGLHMDSPVVCPDTDTLLAFVEAGAGVAFLAEPDQAALHARGIHLLSPVHESLHYATCLSFRRTLSPAAEALRRLILSHLGEEK